MLLTPSRRAQKAGSLAAAATAAALVLGLATPVQANVPLAVPGASAGAQNTIGLLGSRPGATGLPVPVSDSVSASVDVGTGNLSVSIGALNLPGITADAGLGMVYNSRSTDAVSAYTSPRWSMALAAAGTLSTTSKGVLFTSGDGYSALFTPVTGSTTAFTPPAGVKADLVKTSTGYTLTSRTTAEVQTFNADGKAVSLADRNGNKTTLGYEYGKPLNVVSTSGNTGARTATIVYGTSGLAEKFTQTSGTSTRYAGFYTDPYTNNLTEFRDVNGKSTAFTYSGTLLTRITSAAGTVVNFSYDSQARVTKIEKVNTSTGTPGNSATRLAYPSATQVLLAGPNTDQAAAVTAVPRTTYTLDGTGRVTNVVDAAGRTQARTYTADFDTLTASQGTGTTAGTTTNTYGANTGQSMTASKSATGATGKAEYANTAANTKYLATSGTDDAGNKSTYTFNGAGNMLSSSDALAATAALTYNADGTVATAQAPGNGTNTTKYTYNTDKQLTHTTPVTGSSLAAKNFTYDQWGRTKTATDGRGNTTTYTYDIAGRILTQAFSDGTATVSYTYDADGRTTKRVDGSGTTTYGYDQLGRLTSRANTAGGGTIAYGYDKASNLVAKTDSRGTTTYEFDAAGVPTALKYLRSGDVKVLAFGVDDKGRRTDSWLQTNGDRTSWAAHTHTDYDFSGKVTRVTAQTGPGNADNTPVMDLSYCYTAGTTAPNCTANATADRSKVQWIKDNLSGAVSAYTYDKGGRLTKAVVTGGPSPATYTYTYDARGNRLTAGGPSGTQTLAVNAANQITTAGYTFDGAGNLTADPAGAYTYNGAQQMTTATVGGNSYTYKYAGAAQNELLSQTTPQGTYQLTYGRTDALGMPVIEQLKKDNLTAYIEHDPVTGEPLMLRTSTGMQSLYVYDGTGNPAALITNEAYVAFAYSYDPYGKPALTENSGGAGVPQNPYTFKIGLQDRATGWVKYGQRWYSPGIGRWTQMDTLDAPLDPANANRYAYAANDPINNSDPLGLGVCSVTVGIVSLFAGAVAGTFTFGAGILVGSLGVLAGEVGCNWDPEPPVNLIDPPDDQGCQVSPMNGSRWCY
jgi:RHS repeat-associated protein